MGQLVYILGKSGTGKSYSMRNFPKDKIAVINVQGKILPFKGGAKVEQTHTDRSELIEKALEIYSKDYKSIVIDDFQYIMANEFMRRSTERGYDKFTDIGRHAWDIANKVQELPDDVIVYVMCHTEMDDNGNEKIKTIGKLLDEKICLEGMSTIVLKTNVTDGQYSFLTQNSGKDTVKSPAGMFPAYAIDNDLKYVDDKIRSFYELGEFKTDEEMQQADQDATVEETKPERKRRTSTRIKAAADPEPAQAPEPTPAKEPEPVKEEPKEAEEQKPAPRRRKKATEAQTEEPEANTQAEEETPVRTRKRRARMKVSEWDALDISDDTLPF